jgi:geranylgeranyl diphosphate synthase type II
MDASGRIETALQNALAGAAAPECPRLLREAMYHAVFPRGARVRPRLALAVAGACGDDEPALTEAAAASIELLHCASLVHDDLPCFDDAATRRGKPSVHRAFGEPVALLTGDALIVLAFQNLARADRRPERLAQLLLTVAKAVGAPSGIVAGQAWECEGKLDVATYQAQKTGALFAAAAMVGAVAAGATPDPWRELGEKLGAAYQIADDIGDAASDADVLGKPVGRDLALGRPSVVLEYGLGAALRQLDVLVREACAAVPPCPGANELRGLIRTEAVRLVPEGLPQRAA